MTVAELATAHLNHRLPLYPDGPPCYTGWGRKGQVTGRALIPLSLSFPVSPMMLMPGIPDSGRPASQCTPPTAVIRGVSADEDSLPLPASCLEVVGATPGPGA